jgi:hypothetical protein
MYFLEICVIIFLNIQIVFGLFETCSIQKIPTKDEIKNGFYLNSPNFPNTRYASGSSCRYNVQAPGGYEITLSCQINMDNCDTDKFYVAVDGDTTLVNSPNYCSTGSPKIQLESLFNEISFGHTSLPYSQSAGYYSCFIKVKKQKSCECGWSIQARVVNGVETSPNEFISMAGLQKVGDPFNRVFAGGTLSKLPIISPIKDITYHILFSSSL